MCILKEKIKHCQKIEESTTTKNSCVVLFHVWLGWCTIIDEHFLPPVHLDRKNNYWWNCFLSAHLIKDCV